MIRKSDWEALHEELAAEDRRTLGDPPTVEELEAYSRGELSSEEETRVRALLVAYPELARAFVAEFPEDDAAEGDEDYLSPDEVSRRLADFRKSVHSTPAPHRQAGRVLLFRYVPTAVAAALALIFAGLYWQAQSTARRLSAELLKPRALDEQQLTPDGRRGPSGATTITVDGDGALLVVPLFDAAHFSNYRVALFDAEPRKLLWSSTDVPRDADDAFRIVVPRQRLEAGHTYQVVVSGLDGTREEELATYSMRVARR
jgi:hypothetical protein